MRLTISLGKKTSLSPFRRNRNLNRDNNCKCLRAPLTLLSLATRGEK